MVLMCFTCPARNHLEYRNENDFVQNVGNNISMRKDCHEIGAQNTHEDVRKHPLCEDIGVQLTLDDFGHHKLNQLII